MSDNHSLNFTNWLIFLGIYLVLGNLAYIFSIFYFLFILKESILIVLILPLLSFHIFLTYSYFNRERRALVILKVLFWIMLIPSLFYVLSVALTFIWMLSANETGTILLHFLISIIVFWIPLSYLEYFRKNKSLIAQIFIN